MGSSLLAVLASYVLPGGGACRQSTLFMFVQLGLILAFALAPRPGLRGAPCACGACCAPQPGHRLAVRRPG